MADIFLSYSHKDSKYAHGLAEDLEKKGYSVWIDDRIDYGEVWPDVIEEAVDACSIFVVIMTPDSDASTWVKNELARAQRKKKYLLPLLLGGNDPWLMVEATQYIDVRNGKLPPQKFYEQLAQIRRKLSPVIKPTEKTTAPPQKAMPEPFLGFEWVTIPAGEFTNGGKKVDLPEYRITKWPVTNLQYKAFLTATGYRLFLVSMGKEEWRAMSAPATEYGLIFNCPVIEGLGQHVASVEYQFANRFCEWASQKMEMEVRLPTANELRKAMLQMYDRAYISIMWGSQWTSHGQAISYNGMPLLPFNLKPDYTARHEFRCVVIPTSR